MSLFYDRKRNRKEGTREQIYLLSLSVCRGFWSDGYISFARAAEFSQPKRRRFVWFASTRLNPFPSLLSQLRFSLAVDIWRVLSGAFGILPKLILQYKGSPSWNSIQTNSCFCVFNNLVITWMRIDIIFKFTFNIFQWCPKLISRIQWKHNQLIIIYTYIILYI